MRRWVFAASAALHAALAALAAVWLAYASDPPPRSPLDVEIVRPVDVVEPPPPQLPGGAPAPAGPSTAVHLPAPRTPQHPRPAPVAAVPVLPVPSTLPAVPVELIAEPVVTDPPPPTDEVAASPDDPGGGSSGPGTGGRGHGLGGGVGDGITVIDHSRPPLPLDLSARTLPYTEAATRDHVSGDVRLVLSVDASGCVTATQLRHGLGHGLDEIALKLAQQLRFRPALDASGAPTASTVRWRYHFEPPPL